MNAKSKWLTEKDGNIIIPKTLDSQTFDSDGNSLAERLRGIDDTEVIQLPKVDPTLIVSDLNYSTEEQLTGKRWIDGKPVYQKSFEFETGDGAQNRTIYEDQNAFLVDINSNMNNVTEASYFKYIETNNANGITISFHQSSQYSNKKYNITILYTKTTDTADSPVDMPVVDKLPFKFGIDENGNYGYIKAGADTVTPFKSVKNGEDLKITYVDSSIASNSIQTFFKSTIEVNKQ